MLFHYVQNYVQKFDDTVQCTVSSNFLLDKGRVAENLQKECLCYFIMFKINLFYPIEYRRRIRNYMTLKMKVKVI